MKCVKKSEEIRRVTNDEAMTMTAAGWGYCPKKDWKALRDAKKNAQAAEKKAQSAQSAKNVKDESPEKRKSNKGGSGGSGGSGGKGRTSKYQRKQNSREVNREDTKIDQPKIYTKEYKETSQPSVLEILDSL